MRSLIQYPKFNLVNDKGPLSTKHLDRLAAEESIRKTEKMIYNELKGKGAEYAVARENNGDIIKWNTTGGAATTNGDRFAEPKKKSEKVHEMARQSVWSADLVRPARTIRHDFVGSGNIINWMS